MNFHKFLFLWLCVAASCTAQDATEDEDEEVHFDYDDSATEGVDFTQGHFIGDNCEERCSEQLFHSFCNKASNTCQCDSAHPIVLNEHSCLPPLFLGDLCNHVESCRYYEPNAICAEVSQYYYKCACKVNYQQTSTAEGNKCIPIQKENSLPTELPTALGIGVGMALFAALMCLVLRLFSNARFGQVRGHYAYAGSPPKIHLTNASTSGVRRSSGGGTPNNCRRQSYSMFSAKGARRPSTGSIRSQTSIYSMSAVRPREPLRPTLSAPTPGMMMMGSITPKKTPVRSPRRIPVFSNVVVEENDRIESSPVIQVVSQH